MSDFLIPLETVEKQLGVKRTTIYKLIAANKFPKPIKLGSASRWSSDQVGAWIEANKAKTAVDLPA